MAKKTTRARTSQAGKRPRERPMMALSFPSDTRYLEMVRDVARRFAESTGFEKADAQLIGLAVDEATTNVIEHAYRGSGSREIEIHFDPKEDSLSIQILHDGSPIDLARIPEFDPKRFAAEHRTGGMGIYIMKQVMDRVDYGTAGSGRQMCLMVRSRKSKPKAD